MAFPTLIIGGAPKCATSSVHRWLTALPGVAGAARKETFYLMDPGHPLAHPVHNVQREGVAGYARLFPESERAHHRVDATTHYLYQDVAPRVLAQLPTSPKVVFLLREPAARALSSFRFSQRTLGVVDPGLDFTRFVELVDAHPERVGDFVHAEGSRFVLARDLAYGRYVDYVERFIDSLGSERVLVLLTEDLSDHPRATLGRLASFAQLTVTPSSFDDFGRRNETYAVRHPRLHALARSMSDSALGHPRLRALVKRSYWRVQKRDDAGAISDRDRATVERLRARYVDANRRLAALVGLDLGAWERPAPSPDPFA